MTEMAIKLAVLDKIYEIYDAFIATWDNACEKYCCICCTRNVTATTLEGSKILQDIDASAEKAALYDRIVAQRYKKRFQPLITTNQLAQLCIEDGEIPEEENDPEWGTCPLLENGQCPIYDVRPFGCRCMVSRHHCGRNGYADMAPLVMTVNNVFLQYIEHLDANGFQGNLTDILIGLKSGRNPSQPAASRSDPLSSGKNLPPGAASPGLIPNRPLKRLMVPPEHTHAVRPLIDALQTIQI